MTELSVVVPVYGCADCLPGLYQRLRAVLERSVSGFELVFVDDCDPQPSWQVIRELARGDPRVKGLRLSRNFGQHAAITAGLAECTGRWVVVMDCDLQDPPEEIPRLYEMARSGYDVVLARRKHKQQSWIRKLAARAYFRLLGAVSRRRLDGEFGSFSIISRPVVDAFLRLQDRDRHYLFIVQWLGFDTATIDCEHAPRARGGSSYSWGSLLAHGFEGIAFQTTVLLRWIVYFGFFVAAVGAVLALIFVYFRLTGPLLPGWTSIIVLLLIIGGFIIMSTGVTGLYIGKIFEQVKGRPLYVIDKRASRDEP